MAVKAFTDAMANLLVNDATLAAALLALLGKPVTQVIRSNVPWEQIPRTQLPCWVIEQGDGQASNWGTGSEPGLVIGHRSQCFTSELDICLLWDEASRDNAADQRAQLPELIGQLMLRNPEPGDVSGAWLQQWQPDQGVRHPLQCWAARIRAEYVIEDP